MGSYEPRWSARAADWTSQTSAIAAVARSRRLTLVTGNVRHFELVPELLVKNWLAD